MSTDGGDRRTSQDLITPDEEGTSPAKILTSPTSSQVRIPLRLVTVFCQLPFGTCAWISLGHG